MIRYRNISGNSGVDAYEIHEDDIHVRFGRTTYVYNDASVGRANLETMKELASAGEGLSTFISQHARKDYASKY